MATLKKIGYRCIVLMLSFAFTANYVMFLNGVPLGLFATLFLGVLSFTPCVFLSTIYTLGELYVNKPRK